MHDNALMHRHRTNRIRRNWMNDNYKQTELNTSQRLRGNKKNNNNNNKQTTCGKLKTKTQTDLHNNQTIDPEQKFLGGFFSLLLFLVATKMCVYV